MWRDIGWDMFQALERYTKSPVGYTSIRDLNGANPTKINEMPRLIALSRSEGGR
jgi:hypothetical protein